MDVRIKNASSEDAEVLVEIYDKAFHDDYVKYGECPGYGRSVGDMVKSIAEIPKFIAYVGSNPVGAVSVMQKRDGVYYIGCLCVIPEYQRKGIGRKLIEFVKDQCKGWKKIELTTPADNAKNVCFYTKKCGFKIDCEEMDGTVKVLRFSLNKSDEFRI